jgi:hypothetical protein
MNTLGCIDVANMLGAVKHSAFARCKRGLAGVALPVIDRKIFQAHPSR